MLLLLLFFFCCAESCSTVVPTCSVSPAIIEDRRNNKNQLTVATFNAEWLFWDNGAGGPSTKCPLDHTYGTCPWENGEMALNHLKNVAKLLKELNVDIIALEEVQDCTVLNCLLNAMGDPSYKAYLVPGTDTATDQEVGLLTRVDPTNGVWRSSDRASMHSNSSTCGAPNGTYESGVSKHLVANFKIQNFGDISMIIFHYLSQPTNPLNCIKRECQAIVTRRLIDQEIRSGRQVIALGDMNDYDNDVPDVNNNKPLSKVSSIIKKSDMVNVASKLPQSERYSNWWDKNNNCVTTLDEYSMIDHMMVTSGLSKLISKVTIYNKHNFGCGTNSSDHFPVVVSFDSATLNTQSSGASRKSNFLSSFMFK